MKRKKLIVLSILITILFGAGLFAVLFLQLVKVPEGAMKNTILPGERVVASRLARDQMRRHHTFRYPKDPSILYIKRVIGLPGESIQIRKQKVYINGAELSEIRSFYSSEGSFEVDAKALRSQKREGAGTYEVFYELPNEELDEEAYYIGRQTFGMREPFQIPQGQYFVLGDNRDDSMDSRFWGTVPKELITGKAFLVYWSTEADKSGRDTTRWDRLFTKLK